MSRRFGKYRVPECACTYNFTCRACLNATVDRNIADRNAAPSYAERIIPGHNYSEAAHFQIPWWAGFNDARYGREYHNPRVLITSRYEYQQGYIAGTPTERVPT